MAVNGVYIVLGEANTVVALLNKARRQYQLSHQPPSLEDTEPLLRNFSDLKEVLNEVADLADMNPLTYLSPFLDVIKAQNTNGPITEAALSSVAKFLSYGLIDANSIKASNAVESVAYAVVHTKFIGGKSSGSDECVLFKILHVLRSLLLSPPGGLLSNEAVCDMMQSCFRIVFEQHLSPLLRKTAEATLSDMTQLIFTRLPTFHEDIRHPYIRKLVMNTKGEKRYRRRKRKTETEDSEKDDLELVQSLTSKPNVGETSLDDSNQEAAAIANKKSDLYAAKMGYDMTLTTTNLSCDNVTVSYTASEDKKDTLEEAEKADEADSESEGSALEKAVLSRHSIVGRKEPIEDSSSTSCIQMPYGLPCCRELLRFLIALTNPLDRQNTESMVILGLNLLTVALEAAADHLAGYSFLMPLIKDNLCRSLLQLLETEKLPVLAATNRACFLLFESMRSQLKFQLEAYFHKLRGIVISEERSTTYEQKEMALESIVQLWRIPGLVTELYLNYDCDLYCSNVFEELTKLLVENAFPMSGLHSASLISLDALLVVIDTIDQNCVCRQAATTEPAITDSKIASSLDLPILSGYEIGRKIIASGSDISESSPERELTEPLSRPILPCANRHAPPANMPSMEQVIDQKKRKIIFHEGTELFNQNPKRGIEFLREKSLLGDDPAGIVAWLRSNPQLDKKKIADYICSRRNADVLEAFVKSFPFENTRLDNALRMFLETFRLPGEAAEISMVMQHFSEQWYKANHKPFNHVDAAFTLSYAIIMLNTDQHNPQVRRNQPPMTVDCFKRNLSGTNGGADFDPEMLVTMYTAIKSEEIVMPAEQAGLVKENYLWKVLLRRGETNEGHFIHAPTGWNDHALFSISWGPAVAALSYVFDKSEHDVILQKSLNGFRKCAAIAAHYGMKDVFDNLVIHLCKFSTLTNHPEGSSEDNLEIHRHRNMNDFLPSNHEGIALAFGENKKAQMATKTLFQLVHSNGDILREGWRNMLECLLQLFRGHLLPSDLIEVDDFVDEKGWVSLVRSHTKDLQPVRNDIGLLSWFGLGGGISEAEKKKLSLEQQNAVKLATTIIAECRPSQLITDSKYLTSSALSELLSALTQASASIVEVIDAHKQGAMLSGENEDALVFYLEIIISISLENKDRLALVWQVVRNHIEWLLSSRFGRNPLLVERAVVGLLRIANRNLFRDNTVAEDVLLSLSLLLRLSSKAMFVFSRQISFGLHELLRTNAANVHKKEHWAILFALLEAAGAASLPDDLTQQTCLEARERLAFSDGEPTSRRPHTEDKGYTSDDPFERRKNVPDVSSETVSSGADSAVSLSHSREWIHLDHKDAVHATEDALRSLDNGRRSSFSRGSLVLRTNLGRHEPAAFLKVCDSLSFLLRDAVHVTPDNFESCIQCLRTMIEASLDGGRYAAGPLSGDAQNRLRSHVDDRIKKSKQKELSTDVAKEEQEVRKEEMQLSAFYQQVSLQLVDLCSILHSLAPGILAQWAANDIKVDASVPFVWCSVWRPLLQAMARLGCDCRRLVRGGALTHLQRAFLPTNMSNLGPAEWESCFGEVLFPLLGKLLEPFSPMDPIGMEDTRVRAMQIVAKTLLNHLSALASLPSFPSIWLRLLDYMDNYLRIDSCGNLNEAVPESLKNMLLVVDNTGLFSSIPGLYQMTVTRMGNVLPQLIRDTIPNPPAPVLSNQTSSDPTSLSSLSLINRLGRIQIAPAIPFQHESSSQPTQLPTVSNQSIFNRVNVSCASPAMPELIEVVVHSGTTSPITTQSLTATLSTQIQSVATNTLDSPLPVSQEGNQIPSFATNYHPAVYNSHQQYIKGHYNSQVDLIRNFATVQSSCESPRLELNTNQVQLFAANPLTEPISTIPGTTSPSTTDNTLR